MKKEYLVYAGIGLLAVLIIVNSSNKLQINEVLNPSQTKSFDSSSLPASLQPPKRLEDNAPLPSTLAKRSLNLSMIGLI
jgi:hypothetical protein